MELASEHRGRTREICRPLLAELAAGLVLTWVPGTSPGKGAFGSKIRCKTARPNCLKFPPDNPALAQEEGWRDLPDMRTSPDD